MDCDIKFRFISGTCGSSMSFSCKWEWTWWFLMSNTPSTKVKSLIMGFFFARALWNISLSGGFVAHNHIKPLLDHFTLDKRRVFGSWWLSAVVSQRKGTYPDLTRIRLFSSFEEGAAFFMRRRLHRQKKKTAWQNNTFALWGIWSVIKGCLQC